MASKTPSSMNELLAKTRKISAEKRQANVGKPNVIQTDTTSGIIGQPESFQTVTKSGDVRLPTMPEMANINTATTGATTSIGGTKDAIAKARKDQAINAFKSAFEQTQGRLQAEQGALTPRFREAQASVTTQDRMAREGQRKGLAQLGLSGAGAAPQTGIAQSVITQGQRSALTSQEQELRADIERRLSEAQMLRDQGIAGAESEAEILMLQNKLGELEKAELDAKIAEEQVKSDYLATIGRFSADYMAEINRVKNDGDPSNDWQIPYLEAARQQKIAEGGLDQAGQPLQQGVQFTVSQALEATRQGFWNEAIAQALGLPFTEASRQMAMRGGMGGGTTTTQPTYQDTGLAGNITGYNEMMSLLNTATKEAGVDPGTGIPRMVVPDVMGKITRIRDNYSQFVQQFGEETVEDVVKALAIEAGLIEDPNATAEGTTEVKEEPEDTSVGTTTDQRRMIDTFQKDEDGNLTMVGKNQAREYVLEQFDSGLINEATALYLMDLYKIESFE